MSLSAGDNGVASGYSVTLHRKALNLNDLLIDLQSRFLHMREEAMTSKDFAPLDALKTALLDAGVEVRMSKTGVELEAGPKFDASKLEGLL